MAVKKRYRDGDRLHAEVFNELLNTVDSHSEGIEKNAEDIVKVRKSIPTKTSQLTNDSGFITKDTNSWRPVKVNNTEILGTGTNTKALNLKSGENVSISHDNNGNVTITSTAGGITYTGGSGVTITDDKINANSDATTTQAINLSNGAPIDALGIWDNDVIPQGTSVQTILEKLLNRELFPSAATKPTFTVSGSNLGVKELKSVVTITTPTTTKNNGKFNASYDSPTQPTVSGVTWSNETVTSVSTGFTGDGDTRTVELGTNKITYTFKKNYSAPSNMPVSNLNHPTQSTSKISTDNTDISAIWAASSVTKTADITATGVYVCFTNINGSTLNDNATTKCALTSGSDIVLNDVPSEVVANKHFKFAFPSDRTVTFQVQDLAGNFVDFSGAYEIETVTNFYNNIDYKILTTTGDKVGVNTYKMILSKSLNK